MRMTWDTFLVSVLLQLTHRLRGKRAVGREEKGWGFIYLCPTLIRRHVTAFLTICPRLSFLRTYDYFAQNNIVEHTSAPTTINANWTHQFYANLPNALYNTTASTTIIYDHSKIYFHYTYVHPCAHLSKSCRGALSTLAGDRPCCNRNWHKIYLFFHECY